MMTGVVAILLAVFAGAEAPVPDPVSWSLAPTEAAARPGETVTMQLLGDILEGWHLYSLAELPGGPVATRITLAPADVFTFAGPIDATKPHVVFDPNFDMRVELYSDRAEFMLPVTISPRVLPGNQTLTVNVRYQSCDDSVCLAPRTARVSVSVQVR
jgi:hypothetical protein